MGSEERGDCSVQRGGLHLLNDSSWLIDGNDISCKLTSAQISAKDAQLPRVQKARSTRPSVLIQNSQKQRPTTAIRTMIAITILRGPSSTSCQNGHQGNGFFFSGLGILNTSLKRERNGIFFYE